MRRPPLGGSLRELSFPKLPKRHGSGGRHIQRVYSVLHRDHDGVVAVGNRVVGQAVALGALYNGEFVLGMQRRVVDADSAVVQRHSGGLKAHGVQPGHAALGPVRRAVA